MSKKKLLLIILAGLVILALLGCGGDKDTSSGDETATEPETEAVTEDETEAESEAEPGEEAQSAEGSAEESAEESKDSGLLSPEFKKTMDDYEAWFDHYCDVMEKYEQDPSDMELLSEMTDLISEEEKMLEQMEAMDESEMNDAELAYYIEVTARIEKKLLEVAY